MRRRKPPDLSTRCIQEWERDGFFAFRVDGWGGNKHAMSKRDLLGCWDVMAVKQGRTAMIQVTTKSNASARLRKIASGEIASDNKKPRIENCYALLDAGVELWLHLFWQKRGPRTRWESKRIQLTREAIEEASCKPKRRKCS